MASLGLRLVKITFHYEKRVLMINRVRSRVSFLSLLVIILLLVLGALSYRHPASAASSLSVQIKSNGTDNNQQTAFAFVVKNTGTSAVSGVSVRVYFTLDGSNTASNYTLEKYYDQSGVATVSSPTLASVSTYYYTVSYGTASLAAGAQWEFQTALHLGNWGTTFNAGNDHYHTGYAVGALPAAYTNTNYLPAYLSGTLAWGVEPGGVPTNTPTSVTPGALPDLTVTSLGLVNFDPCKYSIVTVRATVANSGTANAGAFVVQVSQQSTTNVLTQTINGLAAGQSTTADFTFSSFGTFTALADSTSVIAESDETNNSKTVSIPAVGAPCVPSATPTGPGMPDLSIVSIGGTFVGPACNNQMNTVVSIKNNSGVSVSAPFVVRLNGTLEQTVNGLAGLATTQVQFSGYRGGTNTAVVDATNVIMEYDETNNSLTVNSPVSDALPTCTPTNTPSTTTSKPDLTISSMQVINPTFNGTCAQNTSQALRVVVANIGTANAGAFVVTVNSQQFNVPSLAAGQSTTLDATSFAPTNQATADSTNVIAESNENNNTAALGGPTATPARVCTPASPVPSFTPTPTTQTCPVGRCIEVDIMDTGFVPSSVGFVTNMTTQIRWTNRGTMNHTVTFSSCMNCGPTLPASGTLAPGQSFSLTIGPNVMGGGNYHCDFHSNMTGSINFTQPTMTLRPITNTPTPTPTASITATQLQGQLGCSFLTGTVMGNGSPLGGARVTYTHSNETGDTDCMLNNPGGGMTLITTGPDGKFSLGPIMLHNPDTITVIVTRDAFADQSIQRSGIDTFNNNVFSFNLTQIATYTPTSPSPTPHLITITPLPTTITPTRTNTPGSTSLTTQIRNNGAETNQQTPFAYVIKNTGTTAKSGITVRIYFTLDGTNAALNYALEKYYDQSGVATISAPALYSNNIYYITINYGTASLAAGAQWEFQTSLHLANWGTTYNGANDWYHIGYAANALPAAYTTTNYISIYVSGTLVYGMQPAVP